MEQLPGRRLQRHGLGLAVDTAGGVFIAGQTSSLDFPTVRPLQAAIGSDPLRTQESDMFLARVAPDGQALTFSTYLGGLDEDRAIAVEVERGGDAVFTGMSGGHFPLVKPYQSAHSGYRLAVVLKVSPDSGTLRYSTYLGGSGDDWGVDLDLHGGDNAWVAGRSTSADFPVKDPVQPLYGGADAHLCRRLEPRWPIAPLQQPDRRQRPRHGPGHRGAPRRPRRSRAGRDPRTTRCGPCRPRPAVAMKPSSSRSAGWPSRRRPPRRARRSAPHPRWSRRRPSARRAAASAPWSARAYPRR